MSKSAFCSDKEELARLCRLYRIRRLALFGSVLNDAERPDSDIALSRGV
jgi:predicted nucleotidyltransferase